MQKAKLLMAALMLSAAAAFGQAGLNATVYPGYTFSSNERLTLDKLNALGRPTIYISGTLGGTNVGLAAGSVTGVQLADNVLNTNSLTWDSSTPRAIDVRDQGIGASELSSNAVSAPLTGGAGTALTLNYWTAAFSVVSNRLGLLAGSGLRGGSNSALTLDYNTNQFILTSSGLSLTNLSLTNLTGLTTNQLIGSGTASNAVAVTVGNGLLLSNNTLQASATATTTLAFTNSVNFLSPIPWTNAHGLGRMPSDVRVVFQCISPIGIWQTGDEVDAENATTGSVFKYGSCTVNATNTRVALYNHSGMSVVTSDATISGLTTNYWRLKIYVSP